VVKKVKKVKMEMSPEILEAKPVKKERVKVVVDNLVENPVKMVMAENMVMTEPKERVKVVVDNPAENLEKMEKTAMTELKVALVVKKGMARVVMDNLVVMMKEKVVMEPKTALMVKTERAKVMVENPEAMMMATIKMARDLVEIQLIILMDLMVLVETMTLVKTQAVTRVVTQAVPEAVHLKYR
jgi:hypothetical protein